MTRNNPLNDCTDPVESIMKWCEDHGYAVALFTPDEINDADIGNIQERMIAAGWDAIHHDTDMAEDDPDLWVGCQGDCNPQQDVQQIREDDHTCPECGRRLCEVCWPGWVHEIFCPQCRKEKDVNNAV